MNDNNEIKVPFLTRFFRAVAEDMEIPKTNLAGIRTDTACCGRSNDPPKR